MKTSDVLLSCIDQLDCAVDLNGKSVVVTGESTLIERNELKALLVKFGAKVVGTVTSNVSYLIVGNKASAEWKFGSYGVKIDKAIELKEAGFSINIISDAFLLNHTSNTKVPDFNRFELITMLQKGLEQNLIDQADLELLKSVYSNIQAKL